MRISTSMTSQRLTVGVDLVIVYWDFIVTLRKRVAESWTPSQEVVLPEVSKLVLGDWNWLLVFNRGPSHLMPYLFLNFTSFYFIFFFCQKLYKNNISLK